MNEAQTEKLLDYLDGFLVLNNPEISPIGAILVDNDGSSKVLNIVVEKDISVVGSNTSKPIENSLKEIAEMIVQEKTVAIHSEIEISPSLYNFLLNFSHGALGSGKMLLITNKDLFDTDERFQKVVTSVCRL